METQEILKKINKEMLMIKKEQIKIKAHINVIYKYHVKLNQKEIMRDKVAR